LTDIYRALTNPQTRTDPLNHIRILNALARLNREALTLRKYNDLRADKEVAKLKPANANPTEEEIRNGLLLGFEKAWGIKPADGPIGPDLNVLLGHQSSNPSIHQSAQSAPQSDVGGSSPPSPQPASCASEGEALPAIHQSNNPSIHQSAPAVPAPPAIAIQKLEIENCYACSVPLPPLRPDGSRPEPCCPGCHIRLYPPGTTYDHCPMCDAFAPILPSGERHSKECSHCQQVLPPPGQRYTAACPGCGLKLRNYNQFGHLITNRCLDCHTLLPLLESIPPATLSHTLSNTSSQRPPPLTDDSPPLLNAA
jgi:hypothetical protein